MSDYEILIKGGTIVDGTRTPRYVSDIAIKDGKIVQIGGLNNSTADKVLDARGRIGDRSTPVLGDKSSKSTGLLMKERTKP